VLLNVNVPEKLEWRGEVHAAIEENHANRFLREGKDPALGRIITG